MSRLEIAEDSAPGTVIRLFVVICPALVIGSLIGSGALATSRALVDSGHGDIVAYLIAGLIAGAATGLLIGPPRIATGPTIIAAVIGLLVLTAVAVYTLASVSHVIDRPINWAQLPAPVLAGTAVQVVLTRVIWALSERTR